MFRTHGGGREERRLMRKIDDDDRNGNTSIKEAISVTTAITKPSIERVIIKRKEENLKNVSRREK